MQALSIFWLRRSASSACPTFRKAPCCRSAAGSNFNPRQQMTDAIPPITGISEIVLSVADLPRMREFYESVLGFSVQAEACHEHGAEADAGGEPTISFLKIADCDTPLGRNRHPQLLVLSDYRRHGFARERLTGHDVRSSTLNHLAFEIPPENFADHQARLDELGLSPSTSEFPAFSAKAIFFKDPEGNVLELICQHDPSSSDK